MTTTWLSFQYTLTETHVGAAGASGAVDLPIVREATTDLPFLTDTALKGVARHCGAALPDKVERFLFGRAIGDREMNEEQSDVGHLSFTQGHLLLYPLRSLQRPFLYATCPLLLSRLDRMTRAFLPKGGRPLEVGAELLKDNGRVRVADEQLFPKDLVVEGMAFAGKDVQLDPKLQAFGKALGALLPKDESATADRLAADLVLLPDEDFVHLLRTAPPVRARISIDEDTGTTSGRNGNLWYEEMLPADCLFWSLVELKDAMGSDKQKEKTVPEKAALDKGLTEIFEKLAHTQIGAGRSTGHGRAWWWRAPGGKQ